MFLIIYNIYKTYQHISRNIQLFLLYLDMIMLSRLKSIISSTVLIISSVVNIYSCPGCCECCGCKKSNDEEYLGFLNEKTIYKVKDNE